MGGIFCTSWSSPGTGSFSTQCSNGPPAANNALNGLMLHTVTIAVRIRNGDHALMICPVL